VVIYRFAATSDLKGNTVATLELPAGSVGHRQHVGADRARIHIGQAVDKQADGVQRVFDDLRHR